MNTYKKHSPCFFLIAAALLIIPLGPLPAIEDNLPAFGRDTVLVWETLNHDMSSTFVVRIAEFFPDRFIEWEDSKTQGTILMPNRAVTGAKEFVTRSLFKGGVDTKGKNATTIWLSKKIYCDLKDKKKTKMLLDGVSCEMIYRKDDRLTVDLNRFSTILPAIVVADDRGSERWFLDQEENPLMLKHVFGNYSQTLISITTDRKNTLRWIKGKKL